MRKMFSVALIAVTIFAAAFVASYFVLDHFYGAKTFSTSTQIMTIEESGQVIITDNARFTVADAELTADNYYRLLVQSESRLMNEAAPAQSAPAPLKDSAATGAAGGDFYYIDVPEQAYKQAVESGEPVAFPSLTLTETEPIPTLPIATSIGIAVGLVAVAIWIGYRQSWGEATSTLLERGLNDMTVRDVEIVGYIMEKDRFTIPELMKLSNASKITVWRTVQKLVANGLVEETEGTKLASNGLGGRGKPSRIYRYVGKNSGRATGSPRS